MTYKSKQEILKQYFGYDSFREGQAFLVDSILAGKDVVGVMPTGAGKSICFQVPSMMFEGITLVISPLISLMKDQVNALTQAGIKAAYLNSSLTLNQYHRVLQNARNGEYKLLYVAPERLLTEEFLDFAQNSNIAMFTIDEAHCISQWGQDFRPSYLKIIDFLSQLPKRPVVSAFTATATAQVREDIVSSLKLTNPEILVTGFDRKNLSFEVIKPADKFQTLCDFLKQKQEETGIIYCTTRKTVEEVCDRLTKQGYLATRYHAGLTDQERKENQDDFIFDRMRIIVATNAFGMGIDKSNVSYVVHYNMPKDLESYYQEAGRAGRDGGPAECVLLYSGQDVRMNLFLIDNNKDAEYAETELEELIKSKDRERLKKMTFYCHTNNCLREYILNYFGDTAPNFCGNCSNCKTNFETIDITVEAQKILSCVYRVKERYGVKTIIDILRGSKNEKILHLRLDSLPTYGIMKNGEKQVREIINYLILNDYLALTTDQYPVLKLGNRSREILIDKAEIQMKLAKDIEALKPNKKVKPELLGVDQILLERLKKIRLQFASQQKVPAFVIFTDSALIDMCDKLPLNDSEFLMVSGVGEAKLKRYGQRFISEISDFVSGKNG
ncbi:DNA helicase RecQ [Clostridium aminobutyricum]|uniref:DNA helicase RecQ n=1 Tax=Clostridium aminobutyricum TaxID=33953 RepID=A0A939IIB5_CLOAM|nr:DNA helicase RecQ [Clostridium aminobutyricum]